MPTRGRKDGRFIATFVNEIYAVLLGVGMGSVVFSDAFDVDDPFHLASVAFIVVVVAKYWWDWVDVFETPAISSQREFWIDLAMMLVFLMLFLHFDQPRRIAGLVLVLSVLDLLWVANFVHETRRTYAATLSAHRWWRLLFLKVLAIGVFAFALAVLERLAPTSPEMLGLLVVIVAFVFVRVFCFGRTRSVRDALLRPAHASDLRRIREIHDMHVLRDGETHDGGGFLLEPVTVDLLQTRLENPDREIFVVEDSRGEILGYADVTVHVPRHDLDDLHWHETKTETLFHEGTHCHIQVVAVDAAIAGRGVGRLIYQTLAERYPEKVFSAFVVRRPVDNQRSMRFHSRQGFEEAAVLRRPSFCGLRHYESRLLVRFP